MLINSSTKEEILIKSLIEEIYDVERKISEINNNKNNIQNSLYQNNQKIIELKDLQNNFNQRINSLNKNFQEEFELKKEEIISQKKQINDLDITLNKYQKEIEAFNINEFKSSLLNNIFENNNNKILSQEKINEIYNKCKINNEKEKDKKKEIMKEIEIYKASESVILNNKKELKYNLDKYDENIKMLKEEKLIINDELSDIISYKETLECINKNNLSNLVKLIKQNNISNKIKEIEQPIKLFLYELMIIDMNQVPSKLYDELSNIFGFMIINNRNKGNKKNNNNSRSQSKEIYTIEIYDKRKINNNKETLNENNHKNRSLNNSYINSFYENDILDKNIFISSIETELNKFLEEKFQINNLLNNIALIIIEQIKINEIELPLCFNENIFVYLSYFFKILYYEKVINNKLRFINKDYKSIKKEYKKAKEFTSNELIKLENKYDEINTKKKESENKLTKVNKEDNFNLTEKEQDYIQLCIKINSIMEQKNDIKNNIISLENDINNKKIEKNNEIEIIKTEIEKMQEEINNINNTNELNTLKNNESIINYRKIIAEKFNIIREQLQSYKQKYGKNISLYNQLINNINNTIQKTRNKTIINDSNYFNDYNFINLNSSQMNNNSNISNKKIYKNNSFNKKNDLELSKNWSKILNKTTSNIKQVSTSSDNNNISSNELIFNYGNKNYNFINNIKIEKTNYSFSKYTSSTISNTNKRKKKLITKKKANSRVKNDFEILDKNDFNINNFISKKEENSKTFSHSFFRKQNKKKETEKKIFKAKTNKGLLNLNLFKNKIPFSGNKKIPKGNTNKLIKLLPLTKITFCYFREISPEKKMLYKKYNPLINTSSKELCQYPFNFIKSTISLSKDYKKIKIIPSTQLEPIDFDITSIENTVVSTGIKSIIDVYRNYCRWKINKKGNKLEEFINEQIIKYNNLSREDIEKCIINKNYNFSLILKDNNRRFEFIICSYDEFKMWINGMAFIIKNKEDIYYLFNDNDKK